MKTVQPATLRRLSLVAIRQEDKVRLVFRPEKVADDKISQAADENEEAATA